MVKEDKTFEEAMQNLQEIVQKLESGELGLEESLKAYEEGMQVSKFCEQKLAAAKESVVTIMKDNEETNFNGEK